MDVVRLPVLSVARTVFVSLPVRTNWYSSLSDHVSVIARSTVNAAPAGTWAGVESSLVTGVIGSWNRIVYGVPSQS
jgi:hypothetical protein